MSLPGTPSEQQKASEEPKQPEVISKAEHEAALKAAQEEQAKFKDEINKLKMQLLDTDYLEYKDRKASEASKPKDSNKPADDLRSEIEALQKRLDRQQQVQDALLADIELKEVMANNPDFNEHKQDMIKYYESNPNSDLTLSQALAIVRDQKRGSSTQTKNVPNEKPSNSMPGNTVTKNKSFKTDSEAGQDAWEQVKSKYGLTSDVI